MKEDRQFVTALARGLEVLRCFTAERPELRVTEIARLTQLPQPTVWRLCHTLLQLGYLAQGSQPEKLRTGIDVLALGASVTRAGIASAAYPYMVEIANRFGASLSLAERSGLQMIIVQRAEAPMMLRLNFSVGTALNMEHSAVGAAYLAATTDDERVELMDALSRTMEPAKWVKHRDYLDQAREMYRKSGYVLNLRNYHPDINAVGVPLVSPHGRPIMAINCGGPSSAMPVERLKGPMAEAMFKLAESLTALL
jgi:DNA-binding IclR family transcriptional regulator